MSGTKNKDSGSTMENLLGKNWKIITAVGTFCLIGAIVIIAVACSGSGNDSDVTCKIPAFSKELQAKIGEEDIKEGETTFKAGQKITFVLKNNESKVDNPNATVECIDKEGKGEIIGVVPQVTNKNGKIIETKQNNNNENQTNPNNTPTLSVKQHLDKLGDLKKEIDTAKAQKRMIFATKEQKEKMNKAEESFKQYEHSIANEIQKQLVPELEKEIQGLKKEKTNKEAELENLNISRQAAKKTEKKEDVDKSDEKYQNKKIELDTLKKTIKEKEELMTLLKNEKPGKLKKYIGSMGTSVKNFWNKPLGKACIIGGGVIVVGTTCLYDPKGDYYMSPYLHKNFYNNALKPIGATATACLEGTKNGFYWVGGKCSDFTSWMGSCWSGEKKEKPDGENKEKPEEKPDGENKEKPEEKPDGENKEKPEEKPAGEKNDENKEEAVKGQDDDESGEDGEDGNTENGNTEKDSE